MKILFTKELDKSWLCQNLAPKIVFEICPALRIAVYPQEKFTHKINTDTNKFIVSSQNAVEAISGLNLKGEFFAVGKNTAGKLAEQGFNVVHSEDYASDLAEYIMENHKPRTWNFFCGNNRRETLFEKLIPSGHIINEIVCYESVPADDMGNPESFDAFAFFSPLAVRIFFSKHSVPENSVIFSIGNTTTEQIKHYTKNKIITAENPFVEKVVSKINEYYDTKE